MNAQAPTRPTTPAISCVVPAYNEAANIGPLLTALTAVLLNLYYNGIRRHSSTAGGIQHGDDRGFCTC